jgi:hypothetical protein
MGAVAYPEPITRTLHSLGDVVEWGAKLLASFTGASCARLSWNRRDKAGAPML